MNRFSMIVILLPLLLSSCGKSAPAEEPVREPEAEPGADADKADAEAPAVEKEPESREKKYVGKAVRTVDGGPAGEGEVSLTIADDQSISGSFTLGGATHAVSGKVDGDRFRCWVRGGAEEPDTVRRGFLEGKSAGDGYQGTFAISGHAGVEPANGTWKAALE
ncbi:MAG: hypothetical protein JRF63_03535 [Deltaproteobacteria bacterium]|nr:hypothetical protein [Deltaproteobacteria bacterium]